MSDDIRKEIEKVVESATPIDNAEPVEAEPGNTDPVTTETDNAEPVKEGGTGSSTGGSSDGKTPWPKGLKALATVLCILLGFSTATSGYYLYNHFTGRDAMSEEEYWEQDFGPTQENDIVIDDTYKIESTTHISDAYKSGDDSKLSDEDKETLKMASEVIDEVIEDDMTDLEKETAIYDWMHKNIRFNEGMMALFDDEDMSMESEGATPDEQAGAEREDGEVTDEEKARAAQDGTPHGVLKNHKAVCAGYATTFRLFMQMLDIDCMVCHSMDRIHSWDLVKIDDHWYHVDIYSDIDAGKYGHFNLNDQLMSNEQDWDKEYFPKADSLEANPGYRNRKSAADVYAIPQLMRGAMEDREGILFVALEKTPTEVERNIAFQMFASVMNSLTGTNPLRAMPMMGDWQKIDGEEIFIITFTYLDDLYETDEIEGISEAQQQRAEQALQQAFGDISDDITFNSEEL